MKVAVTFPDGPTETSESFVVVYRNQFGSLLYAIQNYDDLRTGVDWVKDLIADTNEPAAGMFEEE